MKKPRLIAYDVALEGQNLVLTDKLSHPLCPPCSPQPSEFLGRADRIQVDKAMHAGHSIMPTIDLRLYMYVVVLDFLILSLSLSSYNDVLSCLPG